MNNLSENKFQEFRNKYKDYPGVMDIIISDWWEDEIIIIHTPQCDVSSFPHKYENYTIGLFNPYISRSNLLEIKSYLSQAENIDVNINIESINNFIKSYDEMILKYELTRKV